LADHFAADASGAPLISNCFGIRPDPNRRDPLLINWALPRQRKRHLEIVHKRRMSALCVGDLKRVRATEVTGRRTNAKAVLGSKPAVVHGDAPDREVSARPFANVSRDRRTCGGSSQLDLEDRLEHSFSELGDQVDVISAKRLIHVVNRCAKFDQANATRREKKRICRLRTNWQSLARQRQRRCHETRRECSSHHGVRLAGSSAQQVVDLRVPVLSAANLQGALLRPEPWSFRQNPSYCDRVRI